MSGSEVWEGGLNVAQWILSALLGFVIAISAVFIFLGAGICVLGLIAWAFNVNGIRRPKLED